MIISERTISAYAIPGIYLPPDEGAKKIAYKCFGIEEDDKYQGLYHVYARHTAISLLLFSGFSLYKAGCPFNKDHATALNSKKRFIALIETKHTKDLYCMAVEAINKYAKFYSTIFKVNEIKSINPNIIKMDYSNNHEIWRNCSHCGYEFDIRIYGNRCPNCLKLINF